jgi:S-methylmethionine-dependent homocysteine/selenocysteine methylase
VKARSLLESLQHPRLLDGGMGRELRFRGIENPPHIWSANGLLVAPEVVRQIHLD